MLKPIKTHAWEDTVKFLQTDLWIMSLKFGSAMALCTMLAGVAEGMDRYKVEFDGSFTDIVSSDPECDEVFAETSYHSQFHLVGANRRTLVSHFSHAGEAGFLHNQTFVSLFGYNGDFLYEKTVNTGDAVYNVTGEGFVDQNVVYIEMKAEHQDTACITTATYAGFN